MSTAAPIIPSTYMRKVSRDYDLSKMNSRDFNEADTHASIKINNNKMNHDLDSNTSKANETYVGFSNLPNQIYRKAVKKGFAFNLMIVGPSNVGKSTFINSLLLSDFYGNDLPPPSRRSNKIASRTYTHTVVIKEKSISLKLNVVDCPGYGDFIDNTNCWQPIVDYVANSYDDFMFSESRIEREDHRTNDNRIHACLYFIPPTSFGLSKLDIEFLKSIHTKVNVIILIGKADALTKQECSNLKTQVREDLNKHGITIYRFPSLEGTMNDDLSLRFSKSSTDYQSPFAIIGSSTLITNSAGKKVRGRHYQWGDVEIENLEHSDFAMVRHLLLSVNMQDLIDSTHFDHYEKYRSKKISKLAQETHFPVEDDRDPMLLMDAEKKQHEARLQKMESEIEAAFERKLSEKTEMLRLNEEKMMDKAQELAEEVAKMEAALDQERAEFESERLFWEETQRQENINGTMNGDSTTNNFISNTSSGLGDRVLGELMREKSKTKKRGIF